MQPTLNLIEQLKSASSLQEQRDIFIQHLRPYGYDALTFGIFVDPFTEIPAEDMVWVDGLPDGWMDHYLKNSYQTKDVAVAHCLSGESPMIWGQLFQQIDNGHLPNDLAQVQRDAREVGLKTGFTLPLIGANGARAGISLVSRNGLSDHDHVSMLKANQGELISMCEAFYAMSDWRALGRARFGLSAREREILQWLAAGKSQKEIGMKLGTSHKTVEKQLASAKSKLNARTATQAVAKAAFWHDLEF